RAGSAPTAPSRRGPGLRATHTAPYSRARKARFTDRSVVTAQARAAREGRWVSCGAFFSLAALLPCAPDVRGEKRLSPLRQSPESVFFLSKGGTPCTVPLPLTPTTPAPTPRPGTRPNPGSTSHAASTRSRPPSAWGWLCPRGTGRRVASSPTRHGHGSKT